MGTMVDWGALTERTAHRPWPLPPRPWVMTMSWLDLLFAHWSFEPATLAALLPEGLELDTFEGRAYLGVIPFRMEKVGPRGLGWLPGRLPGPGALQDARLVGLRDGVSGVVDAQGVENASDVSVDRSLADEQALGDSLVAVATGDQS